MRHKVVTLLLRHDTNDLNPMAIRAKMLLYAQAPDQISNR